MRPLLFCDRKVDSFFKGGLIVSQLGKNGEVLAVLQGPWKASGGGGLALEQCEVVSSSFLCHSPRSDKQPVRAQLR